MSHERQCCARVVGESWCPEGGGEPPLAELLDDPIMTLLWRRDGLEREAALAALQGLRTLVQRHSRTSPLRSTSHAAAEPCGEGCCLAA